MSTLEEGSPQSAEPSRHTSCTAVLFHALAPDTMSSGDIKSMLTDDRMNTIYRNGKGMPGDSSQSRPQHLRICKAPRRVTQMVGQVALLLALSTTASANNLYQLYQQASKYDAELAVAKAEYEAAVEAVPLARSGLLPQANAGYRASYTDANPDGSDNYLSHGPNITISQAVFNRAASANLSQAKVAARRAKTLYEAQQQALMLRVSDAYFEVLEAQANLVFRRAERKAIGRQKEQNERRFDVGLVAITDVKDAQAQFDLATAQRIAAQNGLEAAQEALRLITGVESVNLDELRTDTPLAAPSPQNMEQWTELALKRNLALQAAILAAEAANKNVAINRAGRMPTLDLIGIANRNNTEHRTRVDTDSGELRLQLDLPLLTGGRNNALVRQAKAQARASDRQMELQKRLTVQQTRNAYRGVLASISRAEALKQALISTRKSLEAQEAGFAEGLLTSLEVLRSLRDTYRAQSDLSAARYDYIIRSLELKRAAGILKEADLQQLSRWLQPSS